jgi:hypothetical protein
LSEPLAGGVGMRATPPLGAPASFGRQAERRVIARRIVGGGRTSRL